MIHTLLWMATAVNLLEDIPSLELETFLHSSTSTRGILVSKQESVSKKDYQAILLSEKYAQDFRYLREFGITEVEIARSGTRLSVEPVHQSPTLTVKNLDLALASRGAEDVADAKWLASRINAMRSPGAALQKLDLITFLLLRFDEVKARFAGPHDIDANDPEGRKEYANQVRTRAEEMDAVYQILLGKEREDQDPAKDIDIEEVYNYIHSDDFFRTAAAAPLKLVIGDANVLESFCESYEKLKLADRKELFLTRMDELLRDYRGMEIQYAEYNDRLGALKKRNQARAKHGPSLLGRLKKALALSGPDLLGRIRLAQDYRRGALEEYQYFKIPFKADDGRVLFNFFLTDPENRGNRDGFFALSQSRPSLNAAGKNDAVRFVGTVLIPAFKRVPEFLYAGYANSILFQDSILSHLLNIIWHVNIILFSRMFLAPCP